MKVIEVPVMEIREFEKEIGIELVVEERRKEHYDNPSHKYMARFPKTDTTNGTILTGRCGDGENVDLAIIDYCKQISGRKLVIDAMSKERKEFDVPNLIHTQIQENKHEH